MAVEHIRLSLLCLGQVWLVFVKVVWVSWGFVGLRDMFIGCRLLPAFLNSCLRLYLMLALLSLD